MILCSIKRFAKINSQHFPAKRYSLRLGKDTVFLTADFRHPNSASFNIHLYKGKELRRENEEGRVNK